MKNDKQRLNPEYALEKSPFEVDQGEMIGKDPREIPAQAWSGIKRQTAMQAIRPKRLDCSENATEVRKCVAIDCALWPLRMGSYPKGHRESEKLP